MAHHCPDCGQICYCGGDIDDMLLNPEEDVDNCTHCICNCGRPASECECFEDDDFEDEDH